MIDFDISRIGDFPYYAANLLKIKTNVLGPDGREHERLIPFVLNEPQWKLHLLFEKLLHTVGYVRVIILKARREGMSTYVEGRLFHKIHTTPNTHAFIIAHDKESTSTIFDMSKLFYEMLPKVHLSSGRIQDMKPMKRYSSKKELVFENPDERTRFANPGLRSRIEVFTANKVTSSRSGGYSCGHFSEVALYLDAETLISSTVPTIPDIPGSIIVYEGTAFGRGGFFHDEWLNATSEGESPTNFVPIFFSWLEFKAYARPFAGNCVPFLSGCDRKELEATLDDEEKMLISKHNATLENLHFRRHEIRYFKGDIDIFHQEYPTTSEEAFISSGDPYFSREKLRTLLTKCSPPIFVGDITAYGLVENKKGALKLWAEPEKGYEYVLGVDVGGGQKKGDPSVIEVLRVPKGTPFIEQVAEWRDWIDPVILAGKCIDLARYYNEAMIAPEINDHGHTTLNEIKEQYWNLYRWQYFDRFGKYMTNKLGWETNVSTRPLICDYATACINADILILRSEWLVDEMMSFIKRPLGYGGVADEGCKDDRVMAFIIGLFCLAHTHQSASILRELGIFASPIVTEGKPRMIVTPYDHEVRDYATEKAGYFESDQAWLNY